MGKARKAQGSSPAFLSPPTAPTSSAHGLGLGPTLVVLEDPSNKYLQAQQSFYATHPPSHTSVTCSIPNVPPPLPVSLPRLPCIPPLVVHQEQLYFDDGLGAPGRCPHETQWGTIGSEHKQHRGMPLSDVEMDDFMVDLGDLVSKEYDAWIERCWVEAFHYTYTVSLPAMIIGFIQCGSTPAFLRRHIIHGGASIDALLAHNFRILLREEHDRRMSDQDGSRRGVDIGNLLAGLVPGTMTSNTGGASAGGGESSNRLGVGGKEGGAREFPLSATNASWIAQAKKAVDDRSRTTPASNPSSQPPPTTTHPPNSNSVPSSHSLLNTNPATAGSGSTSNSTFQHPQQRHLWDPARTGYGNGICFYDLALLHGRSGDDHAPCMCDLTACRTCFHELLYFRGRREMVMHPDSGHEDAEEEYGDDVEDHEDVEGEESGAEVDGEESDGYYPSRTHNHTHTHAHSHGHGHTLRSSPLQIKHPDMSDIMLVEEHLRTRLHYMASPDVVLRYGDEEEFIPPMEYLPVPTGIPSEPPSGAVTPTEEKGDALAEPTKKPGSKKILQARKMKGGRIVKGGLPPKIVPVPTKIESTATSPTMTTNGGPAPETKPRLNGSQLPTSWAMESPASRNMAVTLTYRHLVKLLHATATYMSPFDFDDYADDSAVLTEIHPLAVYRRLVEPYVRRRAAQYEEMQARANEQSQETEQAPLPPAPQPPAQTQEDETLPIESETAVEQVHGETPVNSMESPGAEVLRVDYTAWKNCMEMWEKEVAVREKEGGNAILKTQPARAVAFYTQAICLDSENPVYYLNRAAAFNAIENYEDAEIDCSRALLLNKSHLKAWYRRAIARKGLGRLDEAEQDMLQLLSQAPNIQAATAELAAIRKEIEDMKRREEIDEVD